ncbi:MAG: hypothetical protein IJR28_03060 [Ottowia sp.]|nr:hypothetical protein [Ottowia sp.]
MSRIRCLFTAAAIALCAILPTAAMAAGKVLYLSTAEGYTGNTANPAGNKCPSSEDRSDSIAFINNAINSFKGQLNDPDVNFINKAGALSTDYQIANARYNPGDPFTPATTKWDENDFTKVGDGDIVVVQSGYKTIDPAKAEVIVQKIKERNDLTFILLLDTCTQCGYDTDTCTRNQVANMNSIMQPAINDALGWAVRSVHLTNSNNWTSELNKYSRSQFASSGSLMPTLMGNSSGSLQCTPQQNVLYPAPTPQAATSGYPYSGNGYTSGWYCDGIEYRAAYRFPSCPYISTTPAGWAELNASSSFGMLVPRWQSNNGQGACIYLGQDNNIFDNSRCNAHPSGAGQCGDLAAMLLSLPAGECNTKPQQTGAMGACANLSAGATCVLADAPAGTPDDQLAVLQTQGDANGEGACQAKVWCSSAEADRAEYCATGEDPSTHCCKAKPPRCAPTSPDCSSSSSPATSLPTLLGLGAMLPLLAARRRRRK